MEEETAESLPPLPPSLPPYLREGLISIDSEDTIDVDGEGNGRDAAVVEPAEASGISFQSKEGLFTGWREGWREAWRELFMLFFL